MHNLVNVAMISAAGEGKRFKNSLYPKQYMQIDGKSILSHTIKAFDIDKINYILPIISHKHQEYYSGVREELKNLRYPKLLEPIFGGDERYESNLKGIKFLEKLNPDNVLIHDAARPFISKDIIINILDALNENIAVIPAINFFDTIKLYEENKKIKTIDRSKFYRAQTPQGFRFKQIFDAYINYNFSKSVTDDSQIMEDLGIDIKIIPGSEENIKITTNFDFKIAEYLYENRHRI